jgi:hypothetical protein
VRRAFEGPAGIFRLMTRGWLRRRRGDMRWSWSVTCRRTTRNMRGVDDRPRPDQLADPLQLGQQQLVQPLPDPGPGSTRPGVASRSSPCRTPGPAVGTPIGCRCATRTGCRTAPCDSSTATTRPGQSTAVPGPFLRDARSYCPHRTLYLRSPLLGTAVPAADWRGAAAALPHRLLWTPNVINR